MSSWDVHRCDSAFGIGKRLERIQADTRSEAEALARSAHGPRVIVTVSGGRARRPPIDWRRFYPRKNKP